MPGCSYRLYARRESGKFGVLWYEHLEGPGAVQATTLTSFEDFQASLELMIEFGKAIVGLKENIREAFSWAFPPQQQPGGWSWTKEGGWTWQPPSSAKVDLPQMQRGETFGSKIREWLKLTEGAVEGANRMSRAEYETLLAQQRIRV